MIDAILNIQRPSFINVSGSYVLQLLLHKNNITFDWKSNDLDIYININDFNFTLFKTLDYIKEILKLYSTNTENQNDFILSNLETITKKFTNIMYNFYLNNYESTIIDNSYLDVLDNIVDVVKIYLDNINIDVIIIDIDIDQYININFDLSIVKNYLDYNNNIINYNNIYDLQHYLCNYDYNKFISNINARSINNIKKFISRLDKYNKRGFKIYLNLSNCNCNVINCLCSIRLDSKFYNTFKQGLITYSNLNNEYTENYFTNIYCTRHRGHITSCKAINTNINTSLCNKLIINKYEFNNFNCPNYYCKSNDSIVNNTIINKIVLLKDLIINYSCHPNNILLLNDDLNS